MSQDSLPTSGGGPPTAATSINFDAQALHEADEAEYHREEQHMQNELRALLTDAFDDLSDEEDLEFGNASHQSQDLREHHDHRVTAGENHVAVATSAGPQQVHRETLWNTQDTQQGTWPPSIDQGSPTSTPYHHPNVYQNTAHDEHYQHHDVFHHSNPDMLQYPGYEHPNDNGYPGYTWDADAAAAGQEVLDYGERGEVEGGNDEGRYYDPNAMPEHDNYHYAPESEQHNYGKHLYETDLGYSELPMPASHDQQYAAPHSDVTDQAVINNNMGSENLGEQDLMHTWPISEKAGGVITGEQDDYQVKYAPKGSQELNSRQTEAVSPCEDPQQSVPSSDKYQHMEKDFLQQTGSGEARQAAQVRILYDARGHRISELTQEVEDLRESGEREKRILKHKLTLTQDEREGLSQSLHQNQHLLQESQQRENEMAGKVKALEMQIDSLSSAKTELVRKLQTAESAVESLNAQLAEIGCNESLVRAKAQHESAMNALRHKYEEQMYSLNSQLDAVHASRQQQDDEIKGLKQQVSQLVKASEDSHIDRADTINRLSRSLEESQRQCRDLLETSSAMETSKLKISLQEVIAGKSIAEDMNSALQEEMKDLKEQVVMYESASQYGILPPDSITSHRSHNTNPSGTLDDSYAQLGIKKPPPHCQTPGVDSTLGSNLSPEETVQGLKSELERCLALYRAKRQLVDKLNKELKETKSSLSDSKQRLTELEKESDANQNRVAELEVQVGEGLETQTQRHLQKAKKERDELQQELQEIKLRLDESAANEEKVTELNCELSRQMSHLIQDFDEDKRQALDKCRETCLAHHEETKVRFRAELEEEYSQRQTHITGELQDDIQKLKDELNSCQQELDEIKDMYVATCREKDELEEKLAHQHEAHLQQMKDDVTREHQRVLEEMKHTLASQSEAKLAQQQDSWCQDQEALFKAKLQQELMASHKKWQSEKEYAMDLAVKRALDAASLEHIQKAEDELEQARQAWEAEKVKEMEDRISEAQRLWRSTELNEAIEATKRLWLTTDLPLIKEEWLASEVLELEAQLRAQYEEADRHDRNQILASLSEELASMKQEKRSLEEKMENVVQQKDAERKQAILQVQDTCEKDYKQFIQEHQDTLNKALKSARLQFAQEKDELLSKHKLEISALQKAVAAQDIEEAISEERGKWSSKLEALTKLHESEKTEMLASHQRQQDDILTQARQQWQEELSEAVTQAEEKARNVNLDEWKLRTEQLQAALDEQEHLFATADAHMEEELSRLQEEVVAQHAEQLQQQMASLEEQYSDDLNKATGQVDTLVLQLENMHADMQALQSRYHGEVEILAKKLDSAEENLNKLRTATEHNKIASHYWSIEKESFEEKISNLEENVLDVERKLDKAEQQRQDAVDSYRRAEQEHSQIAASYKQRQHDLTERLRRAERKLKQAVSQHEAQVTKVQESLEREHSVALDNLKAHIVKIQKDGGKKLDEQKRKYSKEREEMKLKIVELQQQRRELASTPVQTDDMDILGGSAVDKLHRQYMDAVGKIREDVMRHVKDSNEKAALTVREEMVRERQSTARRLKRYYLKFLDKVLTDEPDGSNRAKKMAVMRQLLDNLPEKDSNSSGTTRRSQATNLDDLVTPRSDATTYNSIAKDQGEYKKDALGLPVEASIDQVDKWVMSRSQSDHSYATNQSTPKSVSSFSVLGSQPSSAQSTRAMARRSQYVVSPLQLSPDDDSLSSAAVTPRADTPEENGKADPKSTLSTDLYFHSFPRESVLEASTSSAKHASSSSSKRISGASENTAGRMSRVNQEDYERHKRLASSSPSKARRQWEGSTESLSAIDFTNKEIIPRASKAQRTSDSTLIKDPVPGKSFVPFKYMSLKEKLVSARSAASTDEIRKQRESGASSVNRQTSSSKAGATLVQRNTLSSGQTYSSRNRTRTGDRPMPSTDLFKPLGSYKAVDTLAVGGDAKSIQKPVTRPIRDTTDSTSIHQPSRTIHK